VQVSAPALSRGEKRRLEQLQRRLRNHYMRPLVTTARVQVDPETDARLPDAFRMPVGSIGATKLLQACDAMLQEAAPFEAALLAGGLPSDFFAKFRAVVAEVREMPGVLSTLVGSRVGARTGLAAELRRGRRAVSRIDAVVRATWDGDEAVLAQWRVAKRVQKKPGGRAVPEQEGEVRRAA
jgi:hypothetical protein